MKETAARNRWEAQPYCKLGESVGRDSTGIRRCLEVTCSEWPEHSGEIPVGT